MALSTVNSCILSTLLSLIVFAATQLLKPLLVSSQPFTILGGFLGSLLFVFLLTAVNNLENLIFERGFESQLIPEVITCLFAACAVCASVHRVSVTTCIIFSFVMLLLVNGVSVSKYAASADSSAVAEKTKKKK